MRELWVKGKWWIIAIVTLVILGLLFNYAGDGMYSR
jgi:hypothetical protein